MSEISPLRRKIGTPRPDDKPAPLTPERLWRRAVMHGLTRAVAMDVQIGGVEIARILPEQVAERIEDGALSAFLDGPLGYGVIVVSPGIAAAVLEMLTLGRVQARPLTLRPVTGTDAAMMADPIDRVLAAQQALVAEMGTPTIAAGYRFATRIETAREIAMTLEDDAHDSFAIAVTPEGIEARAGTITIILPRLPPAAGDDEPRNWSDRIGSRVLGAEVALRTELSRLTLTVDALRGLKVGDRLTLGRHVINNVHVIGPAGERLGVGKLGQSCGRKALRLGATPDTFTAASPPKVAAIIEARPRIAEGEIG